MATTTCETCVYYDYDETYDEYACMANLDQDEMERFFSYKVNVCSYYKYYDEYKMVKKQN